VALAGRQVEQRPAGQRGARGQGRREIIGSGQNVAGGDLRGGSKLLRQREPCWRGHPGKPGCGVTGRPERAVLVV